MSVIVTPTSGDMTQHLQTAINSAIDSGNQDVILQPGEYHLHDTIYLGYGQRFTTLCLRSDGNTFGGFGLAGDNSAVRLLAHFKDRPILAIQGARGTTIRGIYLEGGVDNSERFQVRDMPKPEQDESKYDVLGTDDRHRTFCGIAVDPYSGSQPPPAERYSPVHGWSQWPSSSVLIENCSVQYCTTGVCIKPSGGAGASGNSDFVTLRGSRVQFCKWGISINDLQARLTQADSCQITDCHTAAITSIHGPMLAHGFFANLSNFDRCWRLLSSAQQSGMVVSFRDCSAEQLGVLGYASTFGTVPSSWIIDGCQFSLHPAAMQFHRGHTHLTGTLLQIKGTQFHWPWSADGLRRLKFRVWSDHDRPTSLVSIRDSGISTISPEMAGREDDAALGYLDVVNTSDERSLRADQRIEGCWYADDANNWMKPVP